MGAPYRKLSESQRAGRGGGFPARAWALLKRAAVRAVRLYGLRRRARAWAARFGGKRLAWAGLWGRAKAAPAPARGYDSASYARNFDDGAWRDDDDFWSSSGSFACRFGHAATHLGSPAVHPLR